MRAGCVLAAGHGDGAVVEDLVGDVAAGRHRGPDGQRAGVEVGAVAQVLDEVVGADERLDADPLGALPAHLGVAGDRADPLGVHHQHHAVAADAAAHERALRHLGAGVVGAARAEERAAGGQQVDQLAVRRGAGPARVAGCQAGGVDAAAETAAQRRHQRVGVERAEGGRRARRPSRSRLPSDRRGAGPCRRGGPSATSRRRAASPPRRGSRSRPRAKRSTIVGFERGDEPAAAGGRRCAAGRPRRRPSLRSASSELVVGAARAPRCPARRRRRAVDGDAR